MCNGAYTWSPFEPPLAAGPLDFLDMSSDAAADASAHEEARDSKAYLDDGLNARERALLDAAATVFARQGYGDATVQEVADELGILKGSVYHYVRAKDDLLFGVIQSVLARVDAMYADVAARQDLDPLERFAYCVRRQVRFAAEYRAALAVYHHDWEALAEPRRDLVRASRVRHWRFVAGLIQEAQGAGLATPRLDPNVIARFCSSAIASTVSWHDAGDIDVEALGDAIAEFVLLGVVGQNSA